MASQFDSSDFVDTEFKGGRTSAYVGATLNAPEHAGRGTVREEVDSKVTEAQIKLAELKRAQEELERERAALEEMRRRQLEYQNGRAEMVQSLVRGVGLLEEAEFAARRDAEQMAKSLVELRDALRKVQSLHEDTWSKDSYTTELTRALTTIENARMEWNSARLKFPVLSGDTGSTLPNAETQKRTTSALQDLTLLQLCKVGLGLTLPLAVLGAAIFVTLLVMLAR